MAKATAETSTKTKIKLTLSESEAASLKLLLEGVCMEADEDGNTDYEQPVFEALDGVSEALAKFVGVKEFFDESFAWSDGYLVVKRNTQATFVARECDE